MKLIWFVAAIFLIALALPPQAVFAASPVIKDPPYGTTPKYGGTLVIATSSDPRTLWGLLASDVSSQFITCQMFDGLIEFDYQGNFKPVLAQSWEMSSDGRQFTFHLIRNATWSDGVPFTAADVKFTIEQIAYHPETGAYPRAALGLTSPGKVKASVMTPDNYTVVLSWPDPYPTFLPYATTNILQVVLPKHIFEGVAPSGVPAFAAKTNPVTLGPFKFKEYVRGDHITVVRNDNYWRKGEPYLDSIVWKIIPDDTAKMVAFATGEVDLIYPNNLNLKEFARIQAQLPPYYASYRGAEGAGGANVLHMNEKNPILAKKEVRQAIAYAINKTEIWQSVLLKLTPIADNVVQSTRTWAYNTNITKYPYDPKKAEAMLDAAGYPRGSGGIRFTLNFEAYTGNSQWYDSSVIIASQLQKVGIATKLSTAEYAVYLLDLFDRLSYDLAITGISDGPDPGWLRNYLTTPQIRAGPFTNCENYSNPVLDKLFTQYLSEPDYTKRVAYLFQIQKILSDDEPVVPLFEVRGISIVRATYGGWFPSSGAGYYYSNLHNAWYEGSTAATTSAIVTTTPVGTPFPYEWAVAIAVVLLLAFGAFAYTRRKKKQ